MLQVPQRCPWRQRCVIWNWDTLQTLGRATALSESAQTWEAGATHTCGTWMVTGNLSLFPFSHRSSGFGLSAILLPVHSEASFRHPHCPGAASHPRPGWSLQGPGGHSPQVRLPTQTWDTEGPQGLRPRPARALPGAFRASRCFRLCPALGRAAQRGSQEDNS